MSADIGVVQLELNSMSLLKARMCVEVDLPGLKPFWLGRSFGSIFGWILLSIILLVSFAAIDDRAMPL